MARLGVRRANKLTIQSLLVSTGAILLVGVSAVDAYAQAADTTKPTLTSSVTDEAELRNTTDILLEVSDENPDSASITVTHTNGAPVVIDGAELTAVNTTAATAVSLNWPTKKVADGQYKIEYTATDTFGNHATRTTNIRVNNAKPLLTISDTAGKNTLAGIVSRPDVVFRVLVDGQERTDLVPTIIVAQDNETGLWSLSFPDDTKEGAYTVDLFAVATNGVQSDQTNRTLTVSQATPVISPAGRGAASDASTNLPRIGFAERIGEFIAPAIPRSLFTTPAKLFGVPVDDIVQESAPAPVSRTSLATSTGAATKSTAETGGHIVQATESGWRILGITWYWWLVIIGACTAAGVWLIRTVRARRTSQPVLANI